MSAQGAMLGLVNAAGTASSKLVQGISRGAEQPISEANDATKNELMAQRAQMNALKMKNLKLKNRQLQLRNKQLKQKIGGNQ